MDIGDRVKLIKGNPFGIEGVIRSYLLMTRPTDLTLNPTGLEKEETNFRCEADDGTEFFGFEDELELLT